MEPALALEPAPNTNHPQQAWEPPPPGWIKLNVDAAVSESFTSIATVARNDKGEVIKIWAKPISKCTPIMAEASALLWGTQLAHNEKWSHVIFEGHAKNCIDPLSLKSSFSDWSIHNVISSAFSLKALFLGFKFDWIKRDCNSATHVTAKLSLNSRISVCFYKDNLPGVLELACKEDCPTFSC